MSDAEELPELSLKMDANQMRTKTDQEQLWAGEFGSEYVERNSSAQLLASNIALFGQILRATQGVNSVLELGANIGLNLRALASLRPGIELNAVEINPTAVETLKTVVNPERIFEGAIQDYQGGGKFDLVFTKGVLIHLNPDDLPLVYKKMAEVSTKYVLMAEYYNPAPVEINYRGHRDRLFKRDFAGEFLDLFPDFALIDYGFAYRRDPNYPQDDITWFLMKRG